MTHLYKVITGCVAAMLLPLLTACEHKDLCYEHPHSASVEVVFDWVNAPDANPATMSLYLYPEDGSPTVREVPSPSRWAFTTPSVSTATRRRTA